MEKVVKKLSEIEAAAVAIMDSANAKKKEFSDKMDDKISDFDKKVDSETAKMLSDLTKKLQAETEQELLELKNCTQQTLDALENEYNENHSTLAENILSQIVRE